MIPRCTDLPVVQVFVAPPIAGPGIQAEAVEKSAQHVLPRALDGFERYPVPLETGVWLVSVGKWPLQLFVNVPAYRGPGLSSPDIGSEPSTEGVAALAQGFPGFQHEN